MSLLQDLRDNLQMMPRASIAILKEMQNYNKTFSKIKA